MKATTSSGGQNMGSPMKINTVFTVNITNIILKDSPKTDITFLKN